MNISGTEVHTNFMAFRYSFSQQSIQILNNFRIGQQMMNISGNIMKICNNMSQ